MKKIIFLALFTLTIGILPQTILADGGIFASGGGNKTVGQTFTVTVSASGATFDSLQGTISVSGPVDVISFSPGGATWLPGKTPSNGGQFVGITSARDSLTVATIKLRGKSIGSGSVDVSSAKLASQGNIVGSGSGGTTFTIQRAPQLPGAVTVTSSTHPDQNTAYEATTVELSWNKDKNVSGFSYLLDQAADTTPPAKATDANTTATYANQAIGTYYFHLKAQNSDGWGPVTHFKINIKEPDAKIDATLPKPSNIKIVKAAKFVNNIADGTITGIIISGKTQPSFAANIVFDPALIVPAGKTLSATADKLGNFSLTIDFPIKAGLYKLTVQGLLNKTLTPISDPLTVEFSQLKGGAINLITKTDALPPAPVIPPAPKWYEKLGYKKIGLIAGAIVLILVLANGLTIFKLRKRH